MTTERPVHSAFNLGWAGGYLRYGGYEHTGETVAGNLDTLVLFSKELGLSQRFWIDQLREDARTLGPARIPAEMVQDLQKKVGRLFEDWSSELFAKPAILAKEGMLSSTKLLSDSLSFLATTNSAKLPAAARSDLEAAGRCICFGMPTAGAFHLMRAVEAGLRLLYEAQTKAKAPAQPMGPLIQALRSNGGPDLVLDLLDIIRKQFRNPTQHADAVYGTQEAEHLFALTTFAIGKILDQL